MKDKKNKKGFSFKGCFLKLKSKSKSGEKIVKEENSAIKNKLYIGYPARIAIFGILFVLTFSVSYLLVRNAFTTTVGTLNTYQEIGTLDYRVNLKPNNFYEKSYLEKGMVYIASLIKDIDLTFDYRFLIDKQVDATFNYSVDAKLSIADDSGSNVYYTKSYNLLSTKKDSIKGKATYSFKEKLPPIDYDYYNQIANSFKSTYGVDASATLTITLRVTSGIAKDKVSSSNQMSVVIPLSQKSININIDNSSINNTKNIIVESETKLSKKTNIVIAIVVFIVSVASLLKFLELIFAMNKKPNAYDKFVKKIFADYDRLIVETKTAPDFSDRHIIKIERFEELLDARDTLKQPIMFFEVSAHNKCYFYIKTVDDVYLTTIKAVDLEGNKDEKKKNK